MKVNLKILDAAYLVAQEEYTDLRTKELVPKMVFRRRLTRAAKLIVDLVDNVGFENGRIMYSSSFGELKATSNILNAILNEDMISPTDFQNSVYNTAVSYLSILKNNQNEILTISSGDNSGEKLLKIGAVKALDGDEILLLATETLNIPNIDEINKCIDYKEVAVAIRVKLSEEKENFTFSNADDEKYPQSVNSLISICKNFKKNQNDIIEVEL